MYFTSVHFEEAKKFPPKTAIKHTLQGRFHLVNFTCVKIIHLENEFFALFIIRIKLF